MSRRPARVAAALTAMVALPPAAVLGLGAAPADAMARGHAVHAPAEAPWMATLALKGDGPLVGRASCGGALVAPTKVLTAAHCVTGVDTSQLRRAAEYRVGATTFSTHPGRAAGIARVDVDPAFRILPSPAAPDDPDASSATHDLAVVTLDHPVRGVRALPLATRDPRPGAVGVLYGHGITSPTSGTSDALNRGAYAVRRTAACATATPAQVDAGAVLCGQGRAAACTGDSGGPFVVWQDGRRRLAGVFSFGMETAGKPCGAPGPDFFGSVTASRSWLKTVLLTKRAAA